MAWTKAARDAAAIVRKLHAGKKATKKSYLDNIPKVKKFSPMSKPVSAREHARKGG